MQDRIRTLSRAAAEAEVRLLIDAEQSWLQPAIDNTVYGLQVCVCVHVHVCMRPYVFVTPEIPEKMNFWRSDMASHNVETIVRPACICYLFLISLRLSSALNSIQSITLQVLYSE